MTAFSGGGKTARRAGACLGGCGYYLPQQIMAILRENQRNHYGKGYCRPCYLKQRRAGKDA